MEINLIEIILLFFKKTAAMKRQVEISIFS